MAVDLNAQKVQLFVTYWKCNNLVGEIKGIAV